MMGRTSKVLVVFAQCSILLWVVTAVCGSTAGSSAPAPKPTASVSDDAIDRAIKDQRYFNRQFNCLAGEGPCDGVGRRLKAAIPLVVRGLGCPKCTPREEEQMKRVVSYVQRTHPEKWQKLIKKYGN